LVNDRERLKAMGAAAQKAGKPEAAHVLAGMLKDLAEARKSKR
jgi:UDP-N-acetylglucosamine:LPS N-acetylglucosamine transferase